MIDRALMSEEGTQLLSHTLNGLHVKLNSLAGVSNRGRKRKQSEKVGTSLQKEVLKYLSEVKKEKGRRKQVEKTSEAKIRDAPVEAKLFITKQK